MSCQCDDHKDQLGMEQTTGDFSLFFKRVADTLVDLSRSYVDHIIRAGKKVFMTESDMEMKQRFDSKPNKSPPFLFTGLQVTDKSENVISQTSYINSLSLVLKIFLLLNSGLSMRNLPGWQTQGRTYLVLLHLHPKGQNKDSTSPHKNYSTKSSNT